MPRNNNLKPVTFPMEVCFGQKPETEFKNNLDAIKVKILHAPKWEDVRRYLVDFTEATWSPQPGVFDNLSDEEIDEIVLNLFIGKGLPTALETVDIVFLLEGISHQEVTHIVRYRNATFSADCSGDKWWHKKAALVPNSIENSDEFYERYKKINEDIKQLYVDMIDSKQVPLMDARYILPRCLETYYYVKMNLRDCVNLIKHRIDTNIQPETDNVIAYRLYVELLKLYPVLAKAINIHEPSRYYATMARTGKSTNWYQPDSNNDTFDWNEEDFIYGCTRDQLNGTNDLTYSKFNKIVREVDQQIIDILEEKRGASEKP